MMIKSGYSLVGKNVSSQRLIETLHEERQAVWLLYCKIAEMKPAFTNSKKLKPVLSRFSQLLIDYISLGHFGIYEKLLANSKQNAVLAYANKLYPEFTSTTTSAIWFNDAYDEEKNNLNLDNLANDLSLLGENLAKRMELEDQLCSMLSH